MKHAIAKAELEQIREDPLVESAEIDQNEGHPDPFIEVKPTDSLAKQEMLNRVNDYQTWIEVIDPYE